MMSTPCAVHSPLHVATSQFVLRARDHSFGGGGFKLIEVVCLLILHCSDVITADGYYEQRIYIALPDHPT